MSLSDAELRAMLQARATRADARGLREAALAAARGEPRTHRVRGIRTSLTGRRDHALLVRTRDHASGTSRVASRRRSLTALLAAIAVVVAIVLLVVAGGAFGPVRIDRGGRGGVGGGGSRAIASATPSPFPGLPTPTNVLLMPPPYVAGTCPITPTTDLFGGTAPEVMASGVVWRGVSEGWLARRSQKVVLFDLAVTDGDRTPLGATSFIAAVQLPLGAEAPATSPSLRYMPTGNPAVYGVTLPAAGCWLLTLVGPEVASSIVVEAGPEPSAPPPAGSDQQVPTESLPLEPLATCPTSATAPDPGVEPPGSADDWLDPSGVRWFTHPPAGRPDKVVVSGPIGAPQPYERIVATPVGTVNRPPAFVTSKPVIVTPAPGGGAISAGITIPTAGCWAFTYVDPSMTSTVVVAVTAAP